MPGAATGTIPFTVIGGYLGAGKTTLLNHLLRHNDGRRLAVLVNDFGDINIDADLVTSHDGQTIQLANGCICCTMADGFVQALGRLRAQADQIDHVIVEASGVASPAKLVQYATALQYNVDGTLVLIDAEQIRERAGNKYVGETVIRQIESADLLLLNKTDLVGDAERAAVHDWLRALAPGTPIVETRYGQVSPALLFGFREDGPETASGLAAGTPEARVATLDDDSSHAVLYETKAYRAPVPLDAGAFRQWADALPPGVLRAKGIIYFHDNPTQPVVFQKVGRRWNLAPDLTGPGATSGRPPLRADSRLVIIALPGTPLPDIEDTPFHTG